MDWRRSSAVAANCLYPYYFKLKNAQKWKSWKKKKRGFSQPQESISRPLVTRGKRLKLGNLGLGLDLVSFHFHFSKFPLNTCTFIFSTTFPFPALYFVSIYFPLPFISCLTLNLVYLLYFNIGYFNFNYIFVDLLFSQLLCYLIFILMLWIFSILNLFVMGCN